MPKGQYKRKSLEERVLALISKDKTTGCWIFQGTIDKDGYGQISNNCKTVQVHRAMYQSKNGNIPAGLIAGHTCDDKYPKDCKEYRKCCNPDHITPMTLKENVNRAVQLGRYVVSSGAFKKGDKSGENNNKCKLSSAKVLEIRQHFLKGVPYGGLKTLAEEYDVSYITIQAIVGRKNYRQEPEAIPEGWNSPPSTIAQEN